MATKINTNGDIEYSVNDTFKIRVGMDVVEEAYLDFIISENEESSIINNRYRVNSDGSSFTVTLSDADKKKIPIGNYIYKIILNRADGSVITQKSGNLKVKWGA